MTHVRKASLTVGFVLVLAAVALTFASRPWEGAAEVAAQGTGPKLEIGTPSLSSGTVVVPILASGTGFDGYAGFNLHLVWDPGVFTFSSAAIGTGVFGTAMPFCPPAVVDDGTRGTPPWPANGGVTFGCLSLPATPTTFTGVIANIQLTPGSTGCSVLHLVTASEAEARGELPASFGSVTLDAAANVQTNTYGADVTVDVSGRTGCQPSGGQPTATPTVTATPTQGTVTPTFTPTTTPTGTPTKVLRTVTPTSTPVTPAAATPTVRAGQTAVAAATATRAPVGVGVAPGAQRPGLAPAGSGSAGERAGSMLVVIALLGGAGASLLALSGASYAFEGTTRGRRPKA